MKREYCPACEKPEKVCICENITKIDNTFSVTVLRHRSEAGHALNTARILKLSLSNCKLIDGELFDEAQIGLSENSFLVFPGENSTSLDEVRIPENASFVFIDGSWKKAKKILHLNPWLAKLPKLVLPFQQSRYFLRKQSQEGFSTLEACAAVLSKVEGNEEKYEPLLKSLDKLMEQQSSYIPEDLFNKHFSDRIS